MYTCVYALRTDFRPHPRTMRYQCGSPLPADSDVQMYILNTTSSASAISLVRVRK